MSNGMVGWMAISDHHVLSRPVNEKSLCHTTRACMYRLVTIDHMLQSPELPCEWHGAWDSRYLSQDLGKVYYSMPANLRWPGMDSQ
eukprot:scaffold123743_cov46-Prasinocladus_malaysianus.AAC.2